MNEVSGEMDKDYWLREWRKMPNPHYIAKRTAQINSMIIMRINPIREECRRTLERGYNPLSGREITASARVRAQGELARLDQMLDQMLAEQQDLSPWDATVMCRCESAGHGGF